jgi:predicted AAA+ superfamily ATPase
LIEQKDILGMLFENLVIHDLMVYAELHNGKCFYYRDNSLLEVDLIIEMPNGD